MKYVHIQFISFCLYLSMHAYTFTYDFLLSICFVLFCFVLFYLFVCISLLDYEINIRQTQHVRDLDKVNTKTRLL